VVTKFFGADAEADFVSGVSEGAELTVFAFCGDLAEGFKGAVFLEAFDEAVSIEEGEFF